MSKNENKSATVNNELTDEQKFDARMLELEQQAINKMKQSSRGSNSMTNKSVLVELLMANKIDRAVAPIKAARLWFTKLDKTPDEKQYFDKITSIKNSLDTLVSQFNFEDKVAGDKLISGYVLEDDAKGLQIVKQ